MGTLTRAHSEDLGKLLLRVAIGGLMLFHGIHKILHGIAGMPELLQAHGLPGFVAYGVYVGEVVAPLLLLAGFFSRPAALVVAFTMLVAAALVHRADVFVLTSTGAWGLELNALYFLGSLAVFFLGAGRFSVAGGRWLWD